MLVAAATLAVACGPDGARPSRLLVDGLRVPIGSAIGPDGALYVAESDAGVVVRIDPDSGATETFASGLPAPRRPSAGVVDVAFIGEVPYALVSAGDSPEGRSVVGVYRIDGDDPVLAVDLGAWATENPPDTPFGNPRGNPFSMEALGDALLVVDGHHNRVVEVELDGSVAEVVGFGNVVPTGLARRAGELFLVQAGPAPHVPADGVLFALDREAGSVAQIASGAPLLIDVEAGPRGHLYVLSHGDFDRSRGAGEPGLENSGQLLVEDDGELVLVAEPLDRPVSLEIVGSRAFIVTLAGEVRVVDLPTR